MSNTWFQFRQFRIEQDKCAMKVTTDACIQGAWTPLMPHTTRVLDIGTGTGLLALMLAQRAPGIKVDAVEYDADAANQASGNAMQSPWNDRITVIQNDIRGHTTSIKYDLVICNPPFFTNSLLSDKPQKNQARHDISLSKEALLDVIIANLADDGYVSILLPFTEYMLWKDYAAQEGLFEIGALHVQHRPGAQVKRVVGIMSREKINPPDIRTLVIRKDEKSYSDEFRALLGPFYLDV